MSSGFIFTNLLFAITAADSLLRRCNYLSPQLNNDISNMGVSSRLKLYWFTQGSDKFSDEWYKYILVLLLFDVSLHKITICCLLFESEYIILRTKGVVYGSR